MFGAFLEFWEKALLESVKVNPDIAYDVALRWSYHASRFSNNKSLISLWEQTDSTKFINNIVDISPIIANLSGTLPEGLDSLWIENFISSSRELCVLHGRIPVDGQSDVIKMISDA